MNSLPVDAPAEGASPPERRSATPPPRQRFAVAPDAFRLGRARRRVRDYLTLSCRATCIDDVVQCVHEACANAVRHSGSRADIDVFLGFRGRDLQVTVRDHGHGFDTSRFDRRALPDLSSERGWGLFLMSRLADELELRSDGGLVVRLLKRDALRGAGDEPTPPVGAAEAARGGGQGLAGRAAAERAAARVAAEHDELRDALDAAEARFAALIAGLSEGVAVHELVERDGEVVDYRTLLVNAAFERQSGLTAEQVCGRRAGELSGSGAPPRLDEYAWVVTSGESFEFETWVEETERHLDVRAVALGGGRFATVSADVTDRRRSDDELRRAGELAGIAAQERRRAEEQRAHVTAELRRLADESAAAGDDLRARQARLEARQAALESREGELESRQAELVARAAALNIRSDDLDERARALAAAEQAAASAPPAERQGGGETRQLAERVELGEELDAVDRLLRSALAADEVMQIALDAGVGALGADAGTVELRDGDVWVVRCQSGLGAEVVGARQEPQQTPNALRALKYREPFATADMQAARSDVGLAAEHGLRAVLAVPLVVRDQVIGCLTFYGRQVRVFDDSEIDFGRRLGVTTALAVDNALLHGGSPGS